MLRIPDAENFPSTTSNGHFIPRIGEVKIWTKGEEEEEKEEEEEEEEEGENGRR